MKNQNTEKEQQKKVVSRYDQKLEKRRIQAEKEKRNETMLKLTCAAVAILIIVAAIALFMMNVKNKNKALNEAYIKVGDHEITQLEYNYYYNMTVNNYISSYASILPYMGLDTSKNYAEQAYSETMSWKDAFDQMAVSQLIQTKAMIDDAQDKGFETDLTEAYADYGTSIKGSAKTAGLSVSRYYKMLFGAYATKANVEHFVRENLLADAYRQDLMEQNAPTDEKIASYYEEHKNEYDKVSYHSFILESELVGEASEEQIEAEMKRLKKNAEEMESRRKTGTDFRELCLEFATESNKETYQDQETDASLTTDGVYASISTFYQDWLYDESRKPGDFTVIEDLDNQEYHVVEFVGRNNDQATETIKDTLAGEVVTEYLSTLVEKYEVVDLVGQLNYLTIETPEETTGVVDSEITDLETTENETIEAETSSIEIESVKGEVETTEIGTTEAKIE